MASQPFATLLDWSEGLLQQVFTNCRDMAEHTHPIDVATLLGSAELYQLVSVLVAEFDHKVYRRQVARILIELYCGVGGDIQRAQAALDTQESGFTPRELMMAGGFASAAEALQIVVNGPRAQEITRSRLGNPFYNPAMPIHLSWPSMEAILSDNNALTQRLRTHFATCPGCRKSFEYITSPERLRSRA